MPSAKPALVLIPGAWHVAAHYNLVLSHLKDYETHPVTNPSSGANPAITDLKPDIDNIRNAIIPLLDAGKDVIVVMHSYGGLVGGSSLKGLGKAERQKEGLKGGIVGLVYLCAWMVPEGVTMVESGGGRGGKAGPSVLKVEDGRSTHLDPINQMYHDVPLDVAEEAVSHMVPWSTAVVAIKTTYAAHKHIPTTYVYATQDRMIPYERQLELVRDAGVPITTYTGQTSHSPFASRPEWVARIIRRAAGEDIVVE